MNRREYYKKYRESHREEIKKYRESHREESKEKKKKYNESHREESKKYRESHREERRKYRESHREEKRKYDQQPKRKAVNSFSCALSRTYGTTKVPTICKKVVALRHAINHEILSDKILPITEGAFYEAYL